jgi:hypothetical protein
MPAKQFTDVQLVLLSAAAPRSQVTNVIWACNSCCGLAPAPLIAHEPIQGRVTFGSVSRGFRPRAVASADSNAATAKGNRR